MNKKEYNSPNTTIVLIDAYVLDEINPTTETSLDIVAKGASKWEPEDEEYADQGW